jgi:hypothetical protein
MLRTFCVACLLGPLSFVSAPANAQCTPGENPWITLEVVASEPAIDEALEVIDIDRSGCLSVRRASFDLRAGLYRRQLSVSERDALGSAIDRNAILQFDSNAVESAVSRNDTDLRQSLVAGQPERFAVACGETYRLSVDDGADAARIQWYAPKQIAQRHPQVRALTDLVAMIDTLQSIAAVDGATRVAPVSP